MGWLVVLAASAAAQTPTSDAEREFAALRDAYVARFQPLWLKQQQAWWEANITGTDAAFAAKKAIDRELVDLHSDKELFARLKALKDGGQVTTPLLRRELDVMYRAFLPAQADPQLQKQIVELENDVEQIFNTHRSPVGGRTLTENEVREVLATTIDSAAAEAAWKGYMEVGQKAAGKLRELVRLRNELARQLGFRDYYAMALLLQEIDEQELFHLFDELDALTREPFARLKAEMDAARAAHFRIAVADLRPWHFGDLFFQEAPSTPEVNLDDLFKDSNLLDLARRYYASVGLPVDDILARSDLYEQPGKCPHAYCADLNRAGDVRVLANLKPNLYWANTLLHELGHGVYDQHIGADVPFLLHEAAHGITTEAIAVMFGALVNYDEWLGQVLKVDPEQAARVGKAARTSLRTEQLMFSRWAQVMVRFEHAMYADPQQDLGRLWWDLKRRYQLLGPPETVDRPDYAAKTHILTSPVYYQCYMLGELLSAQVRHYLAREVLKLENWQDTSFYGRPEAGAYLRDKVFGPGNLYSWKELIQRATGEPLTARYFAEQFVK
jgi:peptidyl-dipeptidase A